MNQPQQAEHPERALLRTVIENGLRDVPVLTNPLAQLMQMRLVSASPGEVCCHFTLDACFAQGNNVIQGGIVSAMLDFGLAFAAFSRLEAGLTIATVSQTTNFMAPAPVGDFQVQGTLEKSGRRLMMGRAALYGADGALLATATAPMAVVPLPGAPTGSAANSRHPANG